MRVPVKVDFQQGMMQFMEMMNCQRRPSTYYAKTIKQATNIVLKWYAEHKAVDEVRER